MVYYGFYAKMNDVNKKFHFLDDWCPVWIWGASLSAFITISRHMALFHWRRHLRKEKSWDSKSQEKVSTSEFKRGGGESFRKRMQKSERELLGRKWKKQTNRGKWEMMFYMKKICLPAKFEMRRLFSWFGLTHKNSLIILQETTKTDFLFPTIDLC